MRFKNLTIILTLMSLSVVAFVGLTLLPITDGICEWTGDKSSKSYYLNSVHKDKKPNPNNPDAWSEDTREGRGWHLSASLSAGHNEAKASVSPSIYGERAFTEDDRFSGTANVRVWQGSVSEVTTYCADSQTMYDRHNSYHAVCWGHRVRAPVEADEEDNMGEGEEQTIVAAVVGKEYAVIIGVERTEVDGTSTTIEGGVDVGVKEVVNLSIGASHTWTGEDGLTYNGQFAEKVTRYREDVEERQSQSEKINILPGAESGAETSFYFKGTYSLNSVKYVPLNFLR